MSRFLLPAAVVLVGLTLYALFDALMTPAHRVRSLPRWGWVLVVLLLPFVGPVLWLALGRARAVGASAPRPSSPDDDEDFLRTLRAQRRQAERERELDRRERELREREGRADGTDDADDAPDDGDDGSAPGTPRAPA